MAHLFYLFLINSFNIGFLILLLSLAEPFLKKHFSAICLYRIWLVMMFGLLIPLRIGAFQSLISFDLPRISKEFTDSNAGSDIRDSGGANIKDASDFKISGNSPGYDMTGSDEFKNLRFHTVAFLAKNLDILLISLWIAGLLLYILINGIRQYRYMKRLKRFVAPISRAFIQKEYELCITELTRSHDRQCFLNRKELSGIPVLSCSVIASPMTIGIVRPVILLPEEAYSVRELHFLLLHELIHIRRRDIVLKLLRFIALSINWFNPLVIILSRRLDNWCEISCDETVLNGSSQSDRMDYGQLLLKCSAIQTNYNALFLSNHYGGMENMKLRLCSIMNQVKKRPGRFLTVLLVLVIFTSAFISVNASGNKADAQSLVSVLSDGRNHIENISGSAIVTVTPQPVPSGNGDTTSAAVTVTREDVAEFALSCENVSYLWGGNDLSTGVDCSGFVQAVYKEFGYDLPRVSGEQFKACEEVPLDQLLPGDLIFYANSDNSIMHNAIYIGNNQVIHASNMRDGVKISELDYRKPFAAGRIITD